MQTIRSARGLTISYAAGGAGPPLVLVHGAFSDHRTNWEFVLPLLEKHFTVYAIARRGRGATDATTGHAVEDEALDVVETLEAIGCPAYLLGHSYGAHVALTAAWLAPERVKRLILYEPPVPGILGPSLHAALARLADHGCWDEFALSFFRDALLVPEPEVHALRASPLWTTIVEDAPATRGDFEALAAYQFRPHRFSRLRLPVLLQAGTESPGHLYATTTLLSVLPYAALQLLSGQAHEAMTTAPALYAASVCCFLLGGAAGA